VQICSLRLEDFKSYTNTIIDFTPGTNAIVGHNGAGKSSILEAIGFALFDHTPPGYNQADFVREGARSATVTVTFISSLDERTYEVTRRCGASSLYQIYDPELDKKICEGKVDAGHFLRQHLGVEPDTNLSDLFANAVGVPQGLLTSAFLETPARRKPIFDPLLRVEEYKRASDQLREPARVLSERQAQLDVQISGLEARLERLPALEESVVVLAGTIGAAQKELATVEAELTVVQQKRQGLEDLRRQIADLVAAVGQAHQQVTNWENQLGAAEERVAEAVAAQEQVEANRAGYEAYGKAQAEQQALEDEVRQRQTLRDQQASQDKGLSLAEAERARQAKALAEIVEAERTVAMLSEAVAEENRLEAALREAEQRAARLGELEDQIARRRLNAAEAKHRLTELQAGLAQAQSIGAVLVAGRQQVDVIDIALVAAREAQTRCQFEAERLKAQVASLQEGDGVRCPVCEQPLDEAHRQDLLARNQTQLGELRKAWKAAQQEVKRLEEELAAARQQVAAQEEQLRQLPRAEESERAAAVARNAESELTQLEAQIDALADAVAGVKQIEESLATLDHPRRRQEIAAQKAAQRQNVENALVQAEKEIAGYTATLADLEKQLSKYNDLDERMAAVAAQIAANRAADDLYRRNEQLAESLPKRRQDMELARTGLCEAQCLFEKKDAERRRLSAQFDEERYHQLSGQEQHLRSRQGSLEGQLAEQQKRLDEQNAEIVQLRERQAELAASQAQRTFLQQQSELLNFLRTTLREAGPYVTKALVRQISFAASQIFGEIMQDFTRRLHWNEDYGIVLEVDGHERQFAQLSGGEQMSAALSVRLALLREMSNIDVAFFDEPTTNLDETRRESLARQILDIKGFRQMFVISHDDTFEQATENLVRVQRINGASVVHE
jgi:exonuclease SbcC